MGLFDDLTNLVKGKVSEALQGNLPSAFRDVLNQTPLSGLQDQLPGLLEQLQNGGLSEQVKSWLEQGTNMRVSPEQIFSALGEDRVRDIAQRLGLPEDKATELISQYLPKAVDEGARQAEAQGEGAEVQELKDQAR
jgi:uncharacterized protein YidB (DUF937 family)